MSVGIAVRHGISVDGVCMAIRSTARTSLLFFVLAFASAGLARLWPSRAITWLRAKRRYLGVSFAASHAVHAVAITATAATDVPQFRTATSLGSVVFGGTAYLFIAAMAVTSFDRAAAWLGPRT